MPELPRVSAKRRPAQGDLEHCGGNNANACNAAFQIAPSATSRDTLDGSLTRLFGQVTSTSWWRKAIVAEAGDGSSGCTSLRCSSEDRLSRSSSRAKNLISSWRLRAATNSKVQNPSLLRGMPAADLMRKFGDVLRDSNGSLAEYSLSGPVQSINTFVSHTWSTPRWKKFLVFIFHYNFCAAFAASVLAAAITCALTVQGSLPYVTSTILLNKSGLGYTRGALALPVGVLTFFLTLFTFHELNLGIRLPGLRWARPTVFLDKTCVHQTDMDLKRQGIQNLAGMINHSEEMLVLYSDVYLQRLWTCYEVGSWLLLRGGERLIARPVFLPVLMLYVGLCATLFEASWFFMSLLSGSDLTVHTIGITLSFGFTALPPFALFAWLAGRWAADLERLQGHIAKFCLANLQCSDEADRQMVQLNIIAFMKQAEVSDSKATNEEVLAAFESMVRQDLPKLIWSSFGRVGVTYKYILFFTLPHVFAFFDLLAGWLLDGKSTRFIILWSMISVVSATCAGPLLSALVFRLPQIQQLRGPAASLCIGIFAVSTVVMASFVSTGLSYRSLESDAWLAVLLATDAALVGCTYFVYRPL